MNINWFYIPTAIFILSSYGFAQNISYRPYEFTQSGLDQRSDLKKLISKTTIVLPESSLSNLQKIDLPPIRHSMDKDLVTFYNSFIPAQVGSSVAGADVWCAELELSLQASLPTFSNSCKVLMDNLNTALAGLSSACKKIEAPESYLSLQKPGMVNEKDLRTMEGLIRTAGEALTHINYPKGLLNSAMVGDVRKVLRKIRLPELTKGFADATTQMSTAISGVTNAKCFTTAEDKSIWATSAQSWSKNISQVVANLSTLETTGKKQAEIEQKNIIAKGLKRSALPYPSITDKERILLTSFVSGIYWRMRGGGLIEYPPGTLETRRLYTQIPFQTFTEFNCGNDCAALGAQIGMAQKSALQSKGWGEYLNLGRKPGGKDRYDDFLNLVNRGLYQVEGTNNLLRNAGYDSTSLLVGGTQMGACYDFGYEKMNGIDIGMSLQLPYIRFIEFATEYGEFCFGFVLGRGLSETLLQGRK